jgi:hypothetical protein
MPNSQVRTAVYYPHTGIRTLDLLKSGLLLWDQVEYIAPGEGFHPSPPRDATDSQQKLVAEAMELLLACHVPTDDEKERAHHTVELIVNSDLVDRLRSERPVTDVPYFMYAEKFSHKTWELLERSALAEVYLQNADMFGLDYAMPNVLGLVMMSALADACAGTRKRMVTDQHAAYTTVLESFAKNTIGLGPGANTTSKLLDISLKIANLEDIALIDLVEMRRREEKEGPGSSLKALRRSFTTRIDSTAQAIADAKTPTDRKTIQDEFEEDMRRDLIRLGKELRGLTWKVAFSRELAVGVLVGLGLLAVPAGQAFATGMALTGATLAYRRERLEAFERHPMAWLHSQRASGQSS